MSQVPFNILHIITRLDRGGSSENTLITVARLDQHRYRPVLMAGPSSEGADAILIPHLGRKIRPLHDLLAFAEMYAKIRQGRYTIVHTHSSKAGILGRWAARLAGVPIIVHTPHGHVFYGYYERVPTYLFTVLERLTARITDKIITLTEAGIREHVERRIAPREKFISIHSGVDLAPYTELPPDPAAARKRFGLSPDCLVVGSVGRFEPVKGYDILLRAAGLLRTRQPKVQFLLAGEGEEAPHLKRLAEELQVDDRVFFPGWQQELPHVLSALDLFVLPSRNEGMGRVLVQAMAMGTPIVATRVGGIPEVLGEGETGLLVAPDDPVELAAAIERLLTDRELAGKIGEAGRRRASAYSADKMVADIESLYDTLLIQKGLASA
ncbi:MAG: glycosyltransferase family 4 protein [candidate division NC10 bacterium]|nr:glycosyltransferase family 4 protein [candidate division NC10 bacterium]